MGKGCPLPRMRSDIPGAPGFLRPLPAQPLLLAALPWNFLTPRRLHGHLLCWWSGAGLQGCAQGPWDRRGEERCYTSRGRATPG